MRASGRFLSRAAQDSDRQQKPGKPGVNRRDRIELIASNGGGQSLKIGFDPVSKRTQKRNQN
jgi:hypothetical protein